MPIKEELIVRTMVGTVLGLALSNFMNSLGEDVLKPILSRKSVDNLEKEFIISTFGVKINYGDLLGQFLSLVSVLVAVYFGLYLLEEYKVL
jgi:large-conductance mechanosensitive channel